MNTIITELNNKNNFVTISNKYRGGNQAWFDISKYSYRHGQFGGCGSVCAANMVSYLAFEKPEKYGKLVPFKTDKVDKLNYVIFMEEMYRYCRPLSNLFYYLNKKLPVVFGVPFPFMLKAGIRRYIRELKSVKFNIKTMSNRSFSDSLSFIRESLSNNIPVGIVIWANKNMKTYEYHWMTVIGISENIPNGKVMAAVATWGEIRDVCLDDLYYSPNKFKWFGLIAFDPK